MELVNMDVITVEDCIELFEKKGILTILEDGKVIAFVKERD